MARAEEDSLIDELTDSVLKQSLAMLREIDRFVPRATMAVNLSGASLGRKGLPERLLNICNQAGISPKRIVFEVTETQMLRDQSCAVLNVNRLGLMGFGISLDDYGTGYSSLSRLKSLPITELKVDHRFCHGASSRPQLAHILRNCVDLSRDLGIKIVAEGVETKADRALVKQLGFDTVQGFCESPPLRSQELIEWLNRRYVSFSEAMSA